MRGGAAKDRLGLAEPAIRLLEPCEKARNPSARYGDMAANPDIKPGAARPE